MFTTAIQNKEQSVDFVEWCSLVLNKLIEATNISADIRSIGADQYHLARTIFGYEFTSQPEFQASTHRGAMFDAIRELAKVNLIETSSSGYLWKVTRFGRELIKEKDMTSLWQVICQEKLGLEEEQLLKGVNNLSSQTANNHAWIEVINHASIFTELGWPEDVNSLWPLSEELEQTGLINCRRYFGPRIEFLATYRGIVWETR